MYSILVVDDEEPVLDSYSYMISHYGDVFTLAGTARSGSEALTLAHRNNPDIVIMDIAMPGIDGLDTIEELHKSHPDMLCVLSTAYERFDLAQRAIPLGVFAYLVKPVSRKKFLETLENAARHLEERRAGLERRLERVESDTELLHREEENFLLLVTWRTLENHQWERFRRLFQFNSDFGRMVLLEFSMDTLERAAAAEPAPLDDLFLRTAEAIRRRYRCLSVVHLQRLLMFLPESEDIVQMQRYLSGVMREILPVTLSWHIGVGSIHRFQELHRSFSEALNQLPRHEADADTRARLADLHELRRMVSREPAYQDALSACTMWWDEQFRRNSFPVARARMIALFTLLINDVMERNAASEILWRVGDPAEQIALIQTRQEWDSWGSRALRAILEAWHVTRMELPLPLARAVEYVRTHYSEPMQLSGIADLVGVSAGYLSRLFPDHLDTTFNDFLNRVRLDAAEELLIENRLSIKQIAYATGYQDPNYFSRIFKKFKGLSPTSYLTRSEGHE